MILVTDEQLKLIHDQFNRRKSREDRSGFISTLKDGTYVCNKCSKVRNTLGSMRAHVSQDCPLTSIKFTCLICFNRSYTRKFELKQHLMLEHKLSIYDFKNVTEVHRNY